MSYFLNLVFAGLAVGAIYGMLAMGYAIIYKVSRVVNFAQGEIMMLIGYISYSVALRTDASAPLVMLSVIAGAIGVGLLIERFIVRPMLGQPVFSLVMMTIALAVMIRAVVGLIWGLDPYRFPGSATGAPIELFGVYMQPIQLFLLAVYVALCVGVWAFLRFNIVGIAMRATATDSTVSLLMGVSVSRLYRVAWIISALIAGIAGVLFANIYHIGPDLAHVGIRAFPAAILGGLDSVLGSALGGLIIGVVENLAGGYIASAYKEIAGFVVILVILMIRPYGLFGQKDIERV
ncbi:branched-chain amino acid ABC transporter permease [Mesorhizobium microcysteis]|uniref:Branched-chain amino acid ABC transporter permease n=1 Tax=Neoaquamicrobium microcysteis TaxID=2682781 RepID=A0A5D4GY73_9HYPH|nr:branched-chain amino acid ABC transporter permease [Mesorhizobium microcysteis]TYR33536.1 branched-chain amino acid ABC transporter permease [Mesorhizobium microcysteis]